MLLSQDEAKQITDRILQRSKAETCKVSIRGSRGVNQRFAQGSATTNGAVSSVTVTIESSFGQSMGAASASTLDEEIIRKAQARSEEIARLAPPNPEFLPPLGPQAYEASGAAYDEATAAVQAYDLARLCKLAIERAAGTPVSTTGYAEGAASFVALATSAGLFAYDRKTAAEFTVTAANEARNWRGWACGSDTRLARLDTGEIARRAIGKASFDVEPYDLEPGAYTVILEPAAVADLAAYILWFMDARQADEGRGFLSRKGGGNRLGERLFDERVTIVSDPLDPAAPDITFDGDGIPRRRTAWVENGIVKNMSYSRYWAQKNGREPIPAPESFAMAGGSDSVDDMIRETKRGILVTRFWYLRIVDPATLLITGMTRDGNFLIENGRVAGPACNLRFNESPVAAFNKIEALGPAQRTMGGDTGSAVCAPPLLIREFAFSSKSSGT